MKPITINYQVTIPTGPYMNDKLGIEMSVDDDESPLDVYREAKRIIDETHRALNPHLYPEHKLSIASTSPESIPEVKINPEDKKIGVSVASIESCDSLIVLNSYKFIVRKDPALLAAFDKRREQLEDQPA